MGWGIRCARKEQHYESGTVWYGTVRYGRVENRIVNGAIGDAMNEHEHWQLVLVQVLVTPGQGQSTAQNS